MAFEVTASGQAARPRRHPSIPLRQFRSFGDDDVRAFERAECRIREIAAIIVNPGLAPPDRTLRPEIGVGIRSVTKGRAIFHSESQEGKQTPFVLALFLGGQDHLRPMPAG